LKKDKKNAVYTAFFFAWMGRKKPPSKKQKPRRFGEVFM
jgi:hypothetical protein